MHYLASAVMVLILLAPLYLIYRRRVAGKPVKTGLITQIIAFFALGIVFTAFGMGSSYAETAAETVTAASGVTDKAFGMIAAALSTGLSGIGGGIAVAASASAALGAISENEKTFGKAILFVGLAEGVALYGMIISFMLISLL